MILRSSLQGNSSFNKGQLSQRAALFDYKKTLVDKQQPNLTIEQRLNAQDDLLDETRSVKSEFDYSVKKKFVEMLSQQPRLNHKYNLPDSLTLRKLDDDRTSKRSHQLSSLRAQRLAAYQSKDEQAATIIEEEEPETPCADCKAPLSEDELTINQRFVEQAI